ncbi:hypothetical protein [Clostridium sp. ZBS2]|uniref:hypothetical protein n=1 Tax=Clostridium sp. ZBS2 TaxID=2949976 RepID=UPI00207AD75C|nr:hypothetical protein [Clostridium sp. ZBS2]
MLENTLSIVIENLKIKHNLTDYQIKQLSKSMKFWKTGDYIYPGHIKSKLNISIISAYEILETIKLMGILDNVYEVYCRKCSKSKGVFLDTLTDIKEDLCCDFCNYKFDALKDTITLYKVIYNGK